jgi:transposase
MGGGVLMVKRRKQYTEQYRREAVRFLEETGRPLSVVADELKIAPALLSKWRGKYGTGRTELVESEAQELKRLRRENEILRHERDFLKKAAAYFAKPSS